MQTEAKPTLLQEEQFAVQRRRASSPGNTAGEKDKPHADVRMGEDSQKPRQDQEEPSGNKAARSRKLLSCTSATPEWLLSKFSLPMDQIVFSHVQHKTGVLPHFQVRMLAGDSFENKRLEST